MELNKLNQRVFHNPDTVGPRKCVIKVNICSIHHVHESQNVVIHDSQNVVTYFQQSQHSNHW